MWYKVNEVIKKLQEFVESNPKIGEADFGICTIDEYDGGLNSVYNVEISADNFYEKGHCFTINEHDDNAEYSDDDNDTV